MDELRVAIAVIKRFKWVFIAMTYLAAFSIYGFRAALFFMVFIALSLIAYAQDKEREAHGNDHFRGGMLFYRYGQELEDLFLSLPIKSEWDEEKTSHFARSLQERLAVLIQARMPSGLVQIKEDLQIKDLDSGQQKLFLRIIAKSRYGSMLTHFIHYAAFGRTLTAHYFTYLRGIYSELDVVKFALASPFTIWFWGIPWLLNQHSIISDLSRFRSSSFDAIDIKTLYSMSKSVVFEETEQVLREAGLLTEEVQQIINVHKHHHVNKLSISNSANVTLGNISQSAPPQPARQAS